MADSNRELVDFSNDSTLGRFGTQFIMMKWPYNADLCDDNGNVEILAAEAFDSAIIFNIRLVKETFVALFYYVYLRL